MTSTVDDATSTALRESDTKVWQRHRSDVARLVFRALLLCFLLFVTAIAPTALRELSDELIGVVSEAPTLLRDALVGLSQLTALLLPVGVVGVLLFRRRIGEAILVTGAAVAAGVLMSLLVDWLDRAAPASALSDVPSDWILDADFPSVSVVAGLVAGATAASPLLGHAWRRIAWAGPLAAVLVQLVTATRAPMNLAVTLVLGAVVGSAALVIAGAPTRRPGADTLRAVLAAGGLEVEGLGDESSHAGRRIYGGRSNGTPVRVAYLDRDDRDADLLARGIRTIRVQSLDDESLSARPRRVAEHEALLSMMGRQAGASVPEVLAVAPLGQDSAVIAFTRPEGRSLADLTGDAVDDADLDLLWAQLASLHRARIAHRALDAERVVIGERAVSLMGFENARLAASDEQIASDVAQLLVTTAVVVGSSRAADAALRSLPHDRVEAALPFVQRAALPSGTRRTLRHHKGLPEELRSEIQSRLGIEDLELADLDRISLVRVVSWVGFAVLAFFLLTLVSSWSEIRAAMAGIGWAWVPFIVLATVLVSVGGAMSLAGSVLRRIALGEATLVMFGQSFLNRFTPANAGGMAMRIRYLQKGGTQGAVATAAIGLTSAASGVLQVVFIAFFFIWSGSNPTTGVETDSSGGGGLDGSIIAVFVGAVAIALVVVAATPKLRRWFVDLATSTIAKIRSDFGELARRPDKLALLFGGAGLAKFATLVAFVLSCRAFGIDLGFAELGALYLGASTIAAAVPTPGGVGAIEAALVFVLTNAGVDEATAWAAVLLFRLINYWLVTIPGYFSLRACERLELV